MSVVPDKSARWGGLRLEPYKRNPKDADVDSIIQEGTVWERPANIVFVDRLGNILRDGVPHLPIEDMQRNYRQMRINSDGDLEEISPENRYVPSWFDEQLTIEETKGTLGSKLSSVKEINSNRSAIENRQNINDLSSRSNKPGVIDDIVNGYVSSKRTNRSAAQFVEIHGSDDAAKASALRTIEALDRLNSDGSINVYSVVPDENSRPISGSLVCLDREQAERYAERFGYVVVSTNVSSNELEDVSGIFGNYVLRRDSPVVSSNTDVVQSISDLKASVDDPDNHQAAVKSLNGAYEGVGDLLGRKYKDIGGFVNRVGNTVGDYNDIETGEVDKEKFFLREFLNSYGSVSGGTRVAYDFSNAEIEELRTSGVWSTSGIVATTDDVRDNTIIEFVGVPAFDISQVNLEDGNVVEGSNYLHSGKFSVEVIDRINPDGTKQTVVLATPERRESGSNVVVRGAEDLIDSAEADAVRDATGVSGTDSMNADYKAMAIGVLERMGLRPESIDIDVAMGVLSILGFKPGQEPSRLQRRVARKRLLKAMSYYEVNRVAIDEGYANYEREWNERGIPEEGRLSKAQYVAQIAVTSSATEYALNLISASTIAGVVSFDEEHTLSLGSDFGKKYKKLNTAEKAIFEAFARRQGYSNAQDFFDAVERGDVRLRPSDFNDNELGIAVLLIEPLRNTMGTTGAVNSVKAILIARHPDKLDKILRGRKVEGFASLLWDPEKKAFVGDTWIFRMSLRPNRIMTVTFSSYDANGECTTFTITATAREIRKLRNDNHWAESFRTGTVPESAEKAGVKPDTGVIPYFADAQKKASEKFGLAMGIIQSIQWNGGRLAGSINRKGIFSRKKVVDPEEDAVWATFTLSDLRKLNRQLGVENLDEKISLSDANLRKIKKTAIYQEKMKVLRERSSHTRSTEFNDKVDEALDRIVDVNVNFNKEYAKEIEADKKFQEEVMQPRLNSPENQEELNRVRVYSSFYVKFIRKTEGTGAEKKVKITGLAGDVSFDRDDVFSDNSATLAALKEQPDTVAHLLKVVQNLSEFKEFKNRKKITAEEGLEIIKKCFNLRDQGKSNNTIETILGSPQSEQSGIRRRVQQLKTDKYANIWNALLEASNYDEEQVKDLVHSLASGENGLIGFLHVMDDLKVHVMDDLKDAGLSDNELKQFVDNELKQFAELLGFRNNEFEQIYGSRTRTGVRVALKNLGLTDDQIEAILGQYSSSNRLEVFNLISSKLTGLNDIDNIRTRFLNGDISLYDILEMIKN